MRERSLHAGQPPWIRARAQGACRWCVGEVLWADVALDHTMRKDIEASSCSGSCAASHRRSRRAVVRCETVQRFIAMELIRIRSSTASFHPSTQEAPQSQPHPHMDRDARVGEQMCSLRRTLALGADGAVESLTLDHNSLGTAGVELLSLHLSHGSRLRRRTAADC